MKKIVATLILSVAMASATARADATIDLSGSRLGKAHYRWFHRGPNHPAARLFLSPVKGETDAYWAVLFEYASIPGILPRYLLNRLAPGRDIIGFLKKIGTQISVYKMVATQSATYEMRPLKVVDGRIEIKSESIPLQLILAKELRVHDPLAGARIFSAGHKKVSFPKNDFLPHGFQFDIARAAYDLARLDSTWRKSFLPGPYLSAYGRVGDPRTGEVADVALRFLSDADGQTARFSTEPQYANIPIEKRRKTFTNPKSALIEGVFGVNEPVDGMFTFRPRGQGQTGGEHVVTRIGLFIDIFDATQSLGQDVVEVALVNPEDPEDFLMYYEHPDNGEGAEKQD